MSMLEPDDDTTIFRLTKRLDGFWIDDGYSRWFAINFKVGTHIADLYENPTHSAACETSRYSFLCSRDGFHWFKARSSEKPE